MECPVCLEEVSDFQVDPGHCSHHVCLECYQKLLDNEGHIVTCPMCRKTWEVELPAEPNNNAALDEEPSEVEDHDSQQIEEDLEQIDEDSDEEEDYFTLQQFLLMDKNYDNMPSMFTLDDDSQIINIF